MPLDTRKIPQSEWDRHQHTIIGLYHNQKLPLSHQNGGRCVVSVMRDEHDFSASLSQYEAQLRRWDSQKNLKKHEWAFLLVHQSFARQSRIEERASRVPGWPQQSPYLTGSGFAAQTGLSGSPSLPLVESRELITLRNNSPRETQAPMELSSYRDLVAMPTSSPSYYPIGSGDEVFMHPLAQQMLRKLSFLAPNSTSSGTLVLCSKESARNDIPTLVKAIAYSFSNRMEISRCVENETIFGLLKKSEYLRKGLQDLLQAVHPSFRICLADNLFRHAVEIGDAQAVIMVLDMARSIFQYVIDPNKIQCTSPERSGTCTPLEVASTTTNVELAQILLDIGANPNGTDQMRANNKDQALEIAIGKLEDNSPPNYELIRLLLDHHARVLPNTLQHLLWHPLTETWIFEDIIGRITVEDHVLFFPTETPPDNEPGYGEYFIRHLLPDVARILENSKAVSGIRAFFSKCTESVCGTCSYRHKDTMSAVLQLAARRGNTDLVKYILPMVALDSLQIHLIAAIRSGEPDLVDVMLQNGATVNGPAEAVESMSDKHSLLDEKLPFLREMTPLAEAILCGDGSLISRLEDLGALSCIIANKEKHFKAAVTAAAYAGDIRYLRRLFETTSTSRDSNLLTGALQAAVASNQYDVVSFLLANTSLGIGNSILTPRDHPLEIAVSRQNKQIFNLLIDFYPDYYLRHIFSDIMEHAVLWGDVDVVDCLVRSGMRLNNDALTVATLNGDKGIFEYLLANGANPNVISRGKISPLASAVLGGDIEMINLLLAYGASVRDEAALMFAMTYNQGIFETLLSAFVSQFKEGLPGFGGVILSRALHDNKPNRVTQLLAAKINSTNANLVRLNVRFPHVWMRGGKGRDTWGGKFKDEEAIMEEIGGWSPLGYAMKLKNKADGIGIDIVRMLIGSGHDLNRYASDSPPQTPLLLAAKYADMEVMDLLLKKGADVNLRGCGMHHTPLQLACQQGNLKMVEFLLQRGANVSSAPHPAGGGTALQMAAQSGNVEIAQLLIDNEAGIHEPPSLAYGYTAFEWAAKRGGLPCWNSCGLKPQAYHRLSWKGLELRLRHREQHVRRRELGLRHQEKHQQQNRRTIPEVRSPRREPGGSDVLDASSDLAKRLFSKGYEAPPLLNGGVASSASLGDALVWAAGRGLEEEARLLIQAGANVDYMDTSVAGYRRMALHGAAHGGFCGVVSLLAEAGADLEEEMEEGHTALLYAVDGGQTEAVRLLVDRGASLECRDRSGGGLLHVAARSGNPELVSLICSIGMGVVDVDGRDHGQCTPAHSACAWGDLEALRALVDAGANIHLQDEHHVAPLHDAAGRGHATIVSMFLREYLLECGADPVAFNRKGHSPLHLAIDAKSEAVVRILLRHNVDANLKTGGEGNLRGRTPLSLAAATGSTEVFRALMEHGADPQLLGDQGESPLHLAAASGFTEILQFLLETKEADME
ncbi:hypothetical protein PG984_010212 [Apiospora sp. TS-2023a]